jgi:predicted dehydrogenase
MIKLCVVGGGYWGENHLKTLHELGLLAGLVDKENLKRDKAKKKYPRIVTFSNIEEALKENIFDGFIIASPVATHFEIGKKILQHGKPTLIEKPFCERLDEAEELGDLALSKNVCLMVGHLLLFDQSTSLIKEYIDLKRLGNLKYIYSNRLNLGKIRSHEDVFWSFAPHDISLLQYFIGADPLDISSNSHSFVGQKADIQITHLKYPNGVKAHIHSSWLNPFKDHSLVIIGDRGLINYRASHDDYMTFQSIEIEEKKLSDPVINVLDSKKIYFGKNEPLKEELKYFASKLSNNEMAEIAGISSAVQTTRIMEIASKKNVQS